MDFGILFRELAQGASLPNVEWKFHPTRQWRFDYAWPAGMVACELDGGQWKTGGGRHNTDADRDKLNEAAAMGWRVLRFSHRQLEDDPTHCVELVLRALEVNGG